ncbi:MAG: hypothetical protein DI556_21035 [Rhodovulum sulfidophilum]|uniref:HTH gntR-type domain-containing protein n=1 Tax=Rhodovulum sulfidophilum TaxID=35806 RepID=A0A2W5MY74_RHOSU|nr:MAG: hypothetical protein DI556_21035 [Rhodovulum sulfidophilum]
MWRSGPPSGDLPGRIANAIAEAIAATGMSPGTRLPSEAALAKHIGVSRPTLREGIRILQQAGALDVRHGLGTFVSTAQAQIQDPLERQQSLDVLIRNLGMTSAVRDLSVAIVPAEVDVARSLDLEPESPVLLVNRTRLVDGVPLSVSFEYFATDSVERDFPVLSKFTEGSIYQFLRREFGLTFPGSSVKLGAVNASAAVARKLEIKSREAVLLMRQIHMDVAGKPRLYTISYQNSRIIEFTAHRDEVSR